MTDKPIEVTRHLLAEMDDAWFYDVRADGESIGCDMVPKEGNKPYKDADDRTDEFAEWCAAVAERADEDPK